MKIFNNFFKNMKKLPENLKTQEKNVINSEKQENLPEL
jgi:hypothetical protein